MWGLGLPGLKIGGYIGYRLGFPASPIPFKQGRHLGGSWVVISGDTSPLIL